MPGTTQIKLSRRTAPDPQASFRWTTPDLKVTAQPIDAYIKPAQDSDLLLLTQFAETMNTGIKSYTKVQEANRKENMIQAKVDATSDHQTGTDANAKKNKPHGFLNAGWGYEEAYDQSYGEAAGIDMRNEYKQTLAQNNFFTDSADPPAEKEKLYNDLYNKYFGNTLDRVHLMFGASEHIKLARAEGDVLQRDALATKTKTELTNNTMKILSTTLTDYLKSETADPSVVTKMADSYWETSVKPLNIITRDQYDLMFVNQIGSKAISLINQKDTSGKYVYTTSEARAQAQKLLNLLHVPGADGKLLADQVDANGAYKYLDKIEAYESVVNQNEHNRETEDKRKLQETSDKTHADLFAQMFQGKNITQLAASARTNHQLTDSDYTSLLSAYSTVTRGEYFIHEDNSSILDMEMKIESGKGIAKEIRSMYGSKANKDTVSRLLLMQAQIDAVKKKGLDVENDPQYKAAFRYVTEMLPIDRNDPGSAERYATARFTFFQRTTNPNNKDGFLSIAEDIVKNYSQTPKEDYQPKLLYPDVKSLMKAYNDGKLGDKNNPLTKAKLNEQLQALYYTPQTKGTSIKDK